jgi:ubiquinone/menaquinone biosynthesis C-methylase UbiE
MAPPHSSWIGSFRRVSAPLRGLHILDLGCGTGYISLMLGRGNHIVSLDLALEGVRITLARRRTPGGYTVGAGETLPFRETSFNAVAFTQAP